MREIGWSPRRSWLGFAVAILAIALPSVALATHDDPAAPNDPLYEPTGEGAPPPQWGPQQIRAEQAHHLTTGRGAVIAIVDSGIDLDHPDLAANAIAGNTFIDCGEAGCGNGDWRSGPPDQTDEGEGSPHGTHVAGIAGADANNGEGIVGVAPDAELMAVRALDDEGSGSFEDIGLGIRFAVDEGAHVVNLSLGVVPGVGQAIELTGVDERVEEAIQYAHENGVTVVAAAGNESFPLCDEPAFSDGVVCVTATSRQETFASYTNQGVKPDTFAVAAPGGEQSVFCGDGVVSSVPPGLSVLGDACDYPPAGTYDEFLGTSMASPHVAGVAGLLVAQGCTREQILEIFETTSRQGNTEEHGLYTTAYGFGIVDAEAAAAAAVELCDPSNAPPPPENDPPSGDDPPPDEPPADDPPAADPPPTPSPTPPSSDPNDDGPCSNAVVGSKAGESLAGTGGSDRVSGKGGNDRLSGGAGDDCLRGGGGADRLSGDDGDDELRGGRGKDRIKGGDGDDTIRAARGGRDRIDCGPGDDTAIVNVEKDRVARNCETVTAR